MTWRDDRPRAKREHPEISEMKQKSEQIRYKNKLCISIAAQCGTQTLCTVLEVSGAAAVLPTPGGLCSKHSPQGRAWRALLAHSHPRGSRTHLNGSITAELVHAQEGQAHTLRDPSSSHCCCSLQEREQTTAEICMCLSSLRLETSFASDISPLHCHHPFKELSSAHPSSTLLKLSIKKSNTVLPVDPTCLAVL